MAGIWFRSRCIAFHKCDFSFHQVENHFGQNTSHVAFLNNYPSLPGFDAHFEDMIVSVGQYLTSPHTETEMSSFWRNFRYWLHRKISFWQFLAQPVTEITSKSFPFQCWINAVNWTLFKFSNVINRTLVDKAEWNLKKNTKICFR